MATGDQGGELEICGVKANVAARSKHGITSDQLKPRDKIEKESVADKNHKMVKPRLCGMQLAPETQDSAIDRVPVSRRTVGSNNIWDLERVPYS
jgi:hypothetical protein